MKKAAKKEKRGSSRLLIRCVVRYKKKTGTGEGKVFTTLNNISTRGISCKVNRECPLRKGDEVHLEINFEPAAALFCVNGVVVRKTKRRIKTKTRLRYREQVGIQFVDLSCDEKELIRKYARM